MSTPAHNLPNNDPADVLVAQASALLEINRASDALPLLLQALSLAPNDATVLCKIAYTHSRLGNQRETIIWADKAIAQEPTSEWAHRLRAHALWTLGKLKDALRAAHEARRLAPHEPQAHRMLASLYLSQNKLNEAETSARELQTLAPNDSETFLTLARVASARAVQAGLTKKQSTNGEAERFAREALRLAPDSDEAMTLLGQILQTQNKNEEALTLFYAAAKLNPAADSSLKNLSGSLYRRFYLGFAAFVGAAGIAFELVVYRAGLSLWPALLLGVPVAGLVAYAVLLRFRLPLLARQARFRTLPGEMQNTLQQLTQSRWQDLGRSVAMTSALVAVIPAFFLGMLHARFPRDYQAAARGLDSVFHPGALAREQAAHPLRRVLSPWQIELVGVKTVHSIIPPVNDNPLKSAIPRPKWERLASLPGQKAIIVTLTVENQTETQYVFLNNSWLSDAHGVQVSQTISPYGYGSDFKVFPGGSTQTGQLTFIVEEKARPVTLEVTSPGNGGKVQWTLPL